MRVLVVVTTVQLAASNACPPPMSPSPSLPGVLGGVIGVVGWVGWVGFVGAGPFPASGPAHAAARVRNAAESRRPPVFSSIVGWWRDDDDIDVNLRWNMTAGFVAHAGCSARLRRS